MMEYFNGLIHKRGMFYKKILSNIDVARKDNKNNRTGKGIRLA